jgi:hypothetical protein
LVEGFLWFSERNRFWVVVVGEILLLGCVVLVLWVFYFAGIVEELAPLHTPTRQKNQKRRRIRRLRKNKNKEQKEEKEKKCSPLAVWRCPPGDVLLLLPTLRKSICVGSLERKCKKKKGVVGREGGKDFYCWDVVVRRELAIHTTPIPFVSSLCFPTLCDGRHPPKKQQQHSFGYWWRRRRGSSFESCKYGESLSWRNSDSSSDTIISNTISSISCSCLTTTTGRGFEPEL